MSREKPSEASVVLAVSLLGARSVTSLSSIVVTIGP